MELDTHARSAFLAFVVLLLAAVMLMTFRMDAVAVDSSAEAPSHGSRSHSPQNEPVSPARLR